MILKLFNKFWNQWNDFWFKPQNLLALSWMRIVLGISFLLLYIPRQELMDYYTENGIIPYAKFLSLYPDFFKPPFIYYIWPDHLAPIMHIIYLILLFIFTIGLAPRFLKIIMWMIHLGFIQRNIASNFGADYIGGVFLFYLSLAQTNEYLSIKKYLFKKKIQECDFLTSVIFRFIQIQISVIYAYTGYEKLKGMSWWDGTALWQVLSNPQQTVADFSFLKHIPMFFIVMSFLTIFFEIYFPFLVSIKKTKYIALIMGSLFHLGIAFFMGLITFSLVMMSTYFVFIEPEHLKLATDYLFGGKYKKIRSFEINS